jgi:hypothetical protein
MLTRGEEDPNHGREDGNHRRKDGNCGEKGGNCGGNDLTAKEIAFPAKVKGFLTEEIAWFTKKFGDVSHSVNPKKL